MAEPEREKRAPESPDLAAAWLFGLGGAAAGAGLARALGLIVGFPGSDPAPGIAGWLSEHGWSKGPESGFFYYSMVLSPLLAACCFALATRLSARRRGGGVAIAVSGIASAGTLLLVALWFSRSAGWNLLPLGMVGAGAGAALIVPWVQAAARGVASALDRHGSRLGVVLSAGISLAVALLAAGPRLPPPSGSLELFSAALRAILVVAASTLAAAGAGLLLSRWLDQGHAALPGPRACTALRHVAWLLLIRLAPENGAVIGASVSAMLVFGLLAARRAARDADHRMVSGRFLRFVFLPALVVALLFHRDVHGHIDFYHHGEWLVPGAEMLEGRVPFEDLYLQHGLIQNALRTYVTFALFEPTLEMDKLSHHFVFALSHAALLVMGLFLFRSWVTAVLAVLVLAQPGLFVQPRFLGLLLTLAFVLRDLRQARAETGEPTPRTRRWPLLAAGASTALALFWSLDSGVYALVATLGFLAIESLGRREPWLVRARPLVSYGSGFAAGAAPFALWLFARGAFPAFVENSLQQVQTQLSVWGVPYPSLADTLDALMPSGDSWSLSAVLSEPRLVALVAAVLLVATPSALAIAACRGRIGACGYRLLLLSLAGAGLFRTALGRSDGGHLMYVTALLWPLLFALAETAARARLASVPSGAARSLLRSAPAVAVAAWLILGFAPLYAAVRPWVRLSTVRPLSPGGGFTHCPLPRMGDVLIPRSQAKALVTMAAYVDERLAPGETFLDVSNMGAVYFLLERPVPSRYFYAVYAATPEMQRRMIEDLERTRPPIMISSDVLGYEEFDGVPMAVRFPIVADYLRERYRPDGEYGFGRVFTREEAPP